MWPLDSTGYLHGTAGWYCFDPHGVAACVYLFWSRSDNLDYSSHISMINPDGSWTGHGYYGRGVAKIFLIFVLTF